MTAARTVTWQGRIDTQAIVRHELQKQGMLGVTLPSGESATDLLEGKDGAFWRLLLHYLGRSAIIGVGLAIAGLRGRDLVKYSLAAGAAVEAFVLLFAYLHTDPEKKKDEA